jgi:CheY-like chemotaxis protein
VPVNRRLTARLLELGGHQVDLVGDGREAIEAVQSRPYDLVLMDVEMPRLHGLAAAAAIRALPGAAGRVPIIALTAHSEALYLNRCREAGMDDYLTKPIDAGRLAAIVDGLASPAGE